MSTARRFVVTASAVGSMIAAAGVLAPADAATATAGTGGAPVGVITASGSLAVHASPSSHSPRTGSYRKGERVTLDCSVRGTDVGGNRLWYTIDSDASGAAWVSARYVRNVGATPPACNPMHGTVQATTTAAVNQRQGADLADRTVGRSARGATLRAVCWTQASLHHDWVLTAGGRWVARGYLRTARPLMECM